MSWPEPRRKLDVPVILVWAAGVAASLVVWAFLIWFGFGCATGRIVRADVEMTCAAIGEDAKVTYSIPTGEAGVITSAPTQLIACEGGPIIPSLGTIIADAFKALIFW